MRDIRYGVSGAHEHLRQNGLDVAVELTAAVSVEIQKETIKEYAVKELPKRKINWEDVNVYPTSK